MLLQVVDVDSNVVQAAAAGDGGQSDGTARARSTSRSASGARAVAAAMLARRPARRGASAGVAATIEAAASGDSLDVGSDSEAYAVAAAAAATAAQRGWLETEPGVSTCLLRCRSSRHPELGLRVVFVELTELPALCALAAVGCSRSMAGCGLCSPQHPIRAPAGCCCLCPVRVNVCGGRAV